MTSVGRMFVKASEVSEKHQQDSTCHKKKIKTSKYFFAEVYFER
jgi:hypothetical protein